jgi:Concanavalin A-like lectin/glucanases superfamily
MSIVIGPGITVGPGITIDSSPAPFVNPTLEIGSAVTVDAQSPFVGGGNSYVFSSSVDSYIDTPASADWAVGTGDFTIEWFGYQTTTSGFQRVFTVDDFPSIDIGVSIENATFYYWDNNSFRFSSAGATAINTWYHWAVVRQSGVISVYRNGTLRGSSFADSNDINNTVDPLTIGNENTASTLAAFVGYITNFRWVTGLAVYTGAFAVPTTALTATAPANPYGGTNTQAIDSGFTRLLLIP